MQVFSPSNLTITVEYTSRNLRATKTFTCSYEARRFYTQKFKQNKNPSIKTERKD